MANTIRQQILDSLYNDIQNITTANGYHNSIAIVNKGYSTSGSFNSFPAVCIQLGNEINLSEIEGLEIDKKSLDVLVLIYINSVNTTDDAELIIEDFKRFFNLDGSIDSSKTCRILDINGVQKYTISEVSPYLNNNLKELGFLLKVEYYDFLASLVPYSSTLLNPVDELSNVPYSLEFHWSQVTNADTYQIQIATDNSFSHIISDESIAINSFTASLNYTTQYYWRVRGINERGNGEWSSVFSFETTIDPPVVPVLISPTDGFQNGINRQDFNWNYSSFADTYDFRLSTASDFSTLILRENNLVNSSYTIPDDYSLSDGTTYYWSVRSKNSNTNSNWSSTRSFTVNINQYEPETTALLARMTTQPCSDRIVLINNLIKDLKAYGIWNKLDAFYMFASHSNNNGEALLNWIKNSHNCTVNGVMSFTIDRGLISNGTSGYLNTNYIPSVNGVNFTQNSASIGIYSRTNYASGGDAGYDMGASGSGGGGARVRIVSRYSGNISLYILNGGNQSVSGVSTNSQGYWDLVRLNSTNITSYKNGSTHVNNFSSSSSGLIDKSIYISAINDGSNNPYGFAVREYSHAYIGSGLTKSEILIKNTLIETYLTAIGAGIE